MIFSIFRKKLDLSHVDYKRDGRGLHSRRELIRKKYPNSLVYQELRAVLYLYHAKIFVTATTSIMECGEVINLDFLNASDEEIGNAIYDKLLEYYSISPDILNKTIMKPSDWPVFKASKAKTLKEFRANAIRFEIKTINSALLIQCKYVESTNQGEHVGAYISLGPEATELGRKIRKLAAMLSKLREMEML